MNISFEVHGKERSGFHVDELYAWLLAVKEELCFFDIKFWASDRCMPAHGPPIYKVPRLRKLRLDEPAGAGHKSVIRLLYSLLAKLNGPELEEIEVQVHSSNVVSLVMLVHVVEAGHFSRLQYTTGRIKAASSGYWECDIALFKSWTSMLTTCHSWR